MLQEAQMTHLVFSTLLVAATAMAADPVVAPVPQAQMHPGYGVVEKVTAVQVVRRERSAAAGGTASGEQDALPAYRLAVRMPDGSLQYRDLDRPEFRPGDHVLLTNAGDVLPD